MVKNVCYFIMPLTQANGRSDLTDSFELAIPIFHGLWTQNGVSGALSLIEVYIGLSVDYKPLFINSSDYTKSP